MLKAQLSTLIPAKYLYADVSPEEADSLTTRHLRTAINGLLYIGTDEEVVALTSKLLPDDPPPTEEELNSRLNALKLELSAKINSIRDTKEQAGFIFAGEVVDSDPISAARIALASIAAQAALLSSSPFSVQWKCANSTVLTLDAAGMLSMATTLVTKAATIHYYSRLLKDQIDAATSLSDLEAIDLYTGWPE